jgi:peptidoglycan/LPS O-acetylase OafA/YrhL
MKRDYRNLDVLRSIAVLLVLFSHLLKSVGYQDSAVAEALALKHMAHFGVLIFFIHTSLVLMMSMRRLELEQRAVKKRAVIRFYVRRMFRIYPLAMFTVVAVLAMNVPAYFEPAYVQPTPSAIWQNLLLVQNVFHTPAISGPMWSLPLEVQMYVLLPLLYFAAARIRSTRGAVTLLSCGFVVWYVDAHAARLFGYEPVMQYAPWFFMGTAAYIRYQFVAPRLSSKCYGMCLVALIATPCVTHYLMGDDYRAGWITWVAGIALAMALPLFAEIRSSTVKRLSHTVATYSYGIYLSHVPIMWLAFHKLSGAPAVARVATFGVLILAVPVLLYHGLEKPFMNLGSRLSEIVGQERASRTPDRKLRFSIASSLLRGQSPID